MTPAAHEARQEPEAREGMVQAYDYDGEYVGCMGEETWRWLLAHPEVDAVYLAASRAQLEQMREVGQALRDAFPDTSWQGRG